MNRAVTRSEVDFSRNFGLWLVEKRRRFRLCQVDIAAVAAVHRNTVGRWEAGYMPNAYQYEVVRKFFAGKEAERKLQEARR